MMITFHNQIFLWMIWDTSCIYHCHYLAILALHFSKNSWIAANLSCYHLSSHVSKSSKDNFVTKTWIYFLTLQLQILVIHWCFKIKYQLNVYLGCKSLGNKRDQENSHFMNIYFLRNGYLFEFTSSLLTLHCSDGWL